MERPHPMEVLRKMEQQGTMWDEDPRKGFSNDLINFMWDYVGYPTFTDDQSWCACTMNFVLKLCGFAMSEAIPVAMSFSDYGQGLPLGSERPGDIVVFKRLESSWKGHVGFYLGDENQDSTGLIKVLGGNQNNKICERFYSVNDTKYKLHAVRKIMVHDIIDDPDWETLKKLKLY